MNTQQNKIINLTHTEWDIDKYHRYWYDLTRWEDETNVSEAINTDRFKINLVAKCFCGSNITYDSKVKLTHDHPHLKTKSCLKYFYNNISKKSCLSTDDRDLSLDEFIKERLQIVEWKKPKAKPPQGFSKKMGIHGHRFLMRFHTKRGDIKKNNEVNKVEECQYVGDITALKYHVNPHLIYLSSTNTHTIVFQNKWKRVKDDDKDPTKKIIYCNPYETDIKRKYNPQYKAVETISNWFLDCKYNPKYKYCKDRLNKMYDEEFE